MNPIGVILDVLVLGLLGWALALGLTLNKRLKALREGQADFAKAVSELNEAARRAESGLADLRRGAEETLGLLQGRIEVARGLVGELEQTARRAHPVTRFASDGPPASQGGNGDGANIPLPRSTGGVAARSAVAGEVRVADPAPAGFADMIRRTLREAR